MDAMGIHSWTVVAALFCTNLCMTSNGQVKTGKAPANSGLKDAFKFNKAPKQYTSCRIGYVVFERLCSLCLSAKRENFNHVP